MGKGVGSWTVVLTIIAMYIAGLETTRMAGISVRHDGLVHGLMMFGLTFVSITELSLLAGSVLKYVSRTAGNALVIWGSGLTSGEAWTGFLTLFLGSLAAIGGGCCRRAPSPLGTAASRTRAPGSLGEIADPTGLSPVGRQLGRLRQVLRARQEMPRSCPSRPRRSDVEDIS